MIRLVGGGSGRLTVDALWARAVARIERLEPGAALAELEGGALLVDIRSDVDRERDGIVPGSLHVPRTVLEWRLDPVSPWRSPHAPSLDARVVLICDHGYSSVLAAATLRELGFERAADVTGGFLAWRDAGLPVAAAPPPRGPGELPGMSPPDA
jgi:rhodanese-related sulfurtransferase